MESDGVNPAQGGSVQAVDRSTTYGNVEPPPPYSPPKPDAIITSQPVMQQQTIYIQAPLKLHPEFFTCPECQHRVLTKVKYANSMKTHLLAGFLCGCTVWCLLCCLGAIPYIFKTFKQADHYCPNCDKHLGTFSKI